MAELVQPLIDTLDNGLDWAIAAMPSERFVERCHLENIQSPVIWFRVLDLSFPTSTEECLMRAMRGRRTCEESKPRNVSGKVPSGCRAKGASNFEALAATGTR